MNITTKGRYALQVMLDLARQEPEEYVSLKAVAGRQEISVKYLEAIISVLNKGGLVESTRGKTGGYRLARRPDECSVGSILKLVEGTLAPVSCRQEDACPRLGRCAALPLWERLDEIVDSFLESVTLADVLSGNIPAGAGKIQNSY